jgi:hypothetical protein
VTIDGVPSVRDLPPGTVESLVVPRRPDHRTVRLAVQFSGGFRPSDAEDSSDSRWLGLRVRPIVQ